MSVWIELRCNDQSEQHAAKLYTGEKGRNGLDETSECWSNENVGCGMTSSDSTQQSVLRTYKDVTDDALKSGWKKINNNWVCPHCVKYRGRTDLKKVQPF